MSRKTKSRTTSPEPKRARSGFRWTRQEEEQLVQWRRQGVYYYEIGSQLQRSDLSCRLHLHNMYKKDREGKDTALRAAYAADMAEEIAGGPIPALSTELAPEVHGRRNRRIIVARRRSLSLPLPPPPALEPRAYLGPQQVVAAITTTKRQSILPRPTPSAAAYTGRFVPSMVSQEPLQAFAPARFYVVERAPQDAVVQGHNDGRLSLPGINELFAAAERGVRSSR